MSKRNRPCPKCRDVGHDKTGDHLWLMRDGETWACFKPYHPPYIERDGVQLDEIETKDYKINVLDIKYLPIVENKDRRISEETMRRFKVRTEFSEETGIPSAVYYPETYGGFFGSYKKRVLPKRFSVIKKESLESDSVPDFFGQICCPKTGKRLVICAGEEDTLAAYEMLKEKYPDYEPAVVGLPRGESGYNVVSENLSFISGFEEVIVATDNDKAGEEALRKISSIVGERTRTIMFSEKDISDMRVKGKEKEFINAYFSCKEYRPSSIITISDVLDEAIKPVNWGLSYPFERLTKLTYGMKEGGEIIGIGAAPGAGKTTFLRQVQRHLMFNHKEKIAIFPIEEGPMFGLKSLIGSIMNRPIHLPDCSYDQTKAREIGESLQGYAEFYGGDSENWGEVEDAIRYFASKDIRFFFIDPLSALVEHLSASDANTELGKIMRAMRKFRKNQGLTFFHANHLNNPPSGKDHGEGGAVRGSQFSGSRAQWKYSTLLIGLEGNQLAETEEDKHKRKLVVIKDRLGGKTGYINLKYDPHTGNLTEDSVGDRL